MKQRSKEKLYRFTTSECRAHNAVAAVRIDNSNKIPILFYPNSRICWEATDWILSLWKKGIKNSSLESYASKISLFIRFIFSQQLTFEEADDLLLNEFSLFLQNENTLRGPNHVGDIIRRVIDFILWLQNNNYIDKNVIGINDPSARIKCIYKTIQFNKSSGKLVKKTYISHESIPKRDITIERRAIPNNIIDKLWEAIPTFKTVFRQSRYKAILFILENSGGRRIEINKMTVNDIYQAKKTGFLELRTAKKRDGNPWRKVPIEPSELDSVLNYIEHYRNPLIKKKLKNNKIRHDSGMLFISNWGLPLSDKTISDEISTLRRVANIDQPAHPHLFRHRYTTLLLDQIHRQMQDQGFGDIASSVTHKLMSIMGWKSEEMIHVYNDQYLSESDGWKQIEKQFLSRVSDKNTERTIKRCIKQLESQKSPTQGDLEELLIVLKRLLDKAKPLPET